MLWNKKGWEPLVCTNEQNCTIKKVIRVQGTLRQFHRHLMSSFMSSYTNSFHALTVKVSCFFAMKIGRKEILKMLAKLAVTIHLQRIINVKHIPRDFGFNKISPIFVTNHKTLATYLKHVRSQSYENLVLSSRDQNLVLNPRQDETIFWIN